MSKYGELPKVVGEYHADCNEMMYYQYLPIKLKGTVLIKCLEERLFFVSDLINLCSINYCNEFSVEDYKDSYVYLTVKRKYLDQCCSFNRKGYHSDGFMTDDINYIWSDKNPTIFSETKFNLTLDDKISMKEMNDQAKESDEVIYLENSVLRLNQYNIHKVADSEEACIRTFVKISISKDRYNLKGNSKNYLLDYDWEMRDRDTERNIPQDLKKLKL